MDGVWGTSASHSASPGAGTESRNNMPYVFISYENKDIDFAENLIGRLERAGFPAWIDNEIGAGEEWRTEIDLAIRNALALVVIMTPEAKASEYVTYEWSFALGAHVKVIPVMLRSAKLHPRLAALQHLDFTNARSRPWDKLAKEVQAAAEAYQTSPYTLTIYDGRSGLQQLDFKTGRFEGAKGKITLKSSADAADSPLVISRENTEGKLVAWIQSYYYKDKSEVIPVGDAAGARRRLSVRCEARALEADHTLLVTLKMVGAPPGEYLTQSRHRIRSGGWVDVDDYFDVSFSADCQLRFDDRSPSAVPSQLEIRRLVITEHEPPLSLRPRDTGSQRRMQAG